MKLSFISVFLLFLSQSAYSQDIDDLIKKANSGDPIAQYNLGVHYERGDGVAQSYSEAAKWYLKAAEQGDASAQNNLGLYYTYGKGVE